MKKMLAILLSLMLALIPTVSVYADVTDPSQIVVSYTEYEEINDIQVLLQMAEQFKQGIAVVSNTEGEMKISQNGDQVIFDQLISETVYADGSVREDRSNSLLTVPPSGTGSDGQTGGSTTLSIHSIINYSWITDANGNKRHILNYGSTAVAYGIADSTYTINQSLCYRTNSSYGSYVSMNNHTNVPLNTYRSVEFTGEFSGDTSYFLDERFFFYFESIVTENFTGQTYTVTHAYCGENERPT